MLVGRKNCRKIVQFLVEPLMKKEMFKKEGSDELVPAVTIILDGQIRNIIDALSEQNGYEGYPEAVSEILFKGIEGMIKK